LLMALLKNLNRNMTNIALQHQVYLRLNRQSLKFFTKYHLF